MKLYSGPLSNFGAKAEIALREKGVPFELEHVPFTLQERYTPKHPEVLRINPKAQVPVLIDDGIEIFDSTQIFEYLEDKHPSPALWPADRLSRAEARLLELKSDEVLFPRLVTLMTHRPGSGPEADAACEAINAYYGEMEATLEGRDYLAGPFSYADIAFFLAQFFASFLGQGFGAEHPRLSAWRERMLARKAVREVAEPVADFLEANSLAIPAFMAHKAASAAAG